MMEKPYINGTGEESSALPSGEGSSIGSQWDVGLDLDVAQSIITSSFQKQGYKTSSKNVSDSQNGEMSLEEEVNSLDLKQVVIDDDEIKQMEKEQANATVESSADKHSGREDLSIGDRHQPVSNNDLLNDIDSLIASSLSPVNRSPVNGWLESPDWTDTNVHPSEGKLNEEWNSGQRTGKQMNKQACVSSPSSTSTEQNLYFAEGISYQVSPSSTHLGKSPSTSSDVSSHLGHTLMKDVSFKRLSGNDTVRASPQTLKIQDANLRGKISQKSNTVNLENADSVSGILEQEDSLLSPNSTQSHMQNQDTSSVKDLEASSYCLMCPIGYADDDDSESNDLDEHCVSGELIPHGKGSGRGRPKSAQPIRSSVPCEIRPKSDIPTYSNNRIPVTLIVRTEDNKSCLELRPVVAKAPLKTSTPTPSSISPTLNKGVSPPFDTSSQPDSVKSTSMECVEGDGPVSLTGSSHQLLGPGHLPPNFLAQNVKQDYRSGPQYHGTVLSQQWRHSQPAMIPYTPNHNLQHIENREQRNLHQYQEEASFQHRNKPPACPVQTIGSYENVHMLQPSGEICHQTMVPAQKSSIPAYQEIRQEPSKMPPSHYTEHPSKGSNLVVADPEQLEKFGIPFIIVTQASVPNLPITQHVIQTPANPSHSHKPYLPQPTIQKGLDGLPYVDAGNKRHIYQHTLVGNWTAAQITEQPLYNQPPKVSLPKQYGRDPQSKVQTAFYIPPSATSNMSVESPNLPSSRIIYQIPQQQPLPVADSRPSTLPSTVDPDFFSSSSKEGGIGVHEVVRASPNGYHPLLGSNPARNNPRMDCLGIPKEDKQSRTEAWIIQSSKMPSHPMHPYEHYPHRASSHAGATLPSKPVGLFQGVEITGPVSKKDSEKSNAVGKKCGASKAKGLKKGRSTAKMKEVDTNSSHQIYIKELPRKAQLNETIGHSNQENSLNEVRLSSKDWSHTDKKIDRIVALQKLNNMSRKQSPEQLNNIKDKTQLDKMLVHDKFAEADEEIYKIMFGRSIRENKLKNLSDPLEKFSEIFDDPLFDCPTSSATMNQKVEVSVATPASQAPVLSQEWNIDPNQYLTSKDRKSLEERIHCQNNSLEKYLRMGNSNNSNKNTTRDLNAQIGLDVCLTASDVTPQFPVHNDESLFIRQLDHSNGQKSIQPPKEMAKIDILAWQQQSAAIKQGAPGLQRQYVAEPQFDMLNPSAHEFPQLLQSLTSQGDEDMKSASLELSSNSRNPPAKHGHDQSHGCVNTSAAFHPQHHFSNTDLAVNDIGYASLTPKEQCFKRPHHPAIKHTYPTNCLPYGNTNTHSQHMPLSACISHPQPLMASSVVLASSQPMSSMKGDSDASMQSDLSRQSRQDRSMTSVDGKLQQIPESFTQSHSAVVTKDQGKSSIKVKEWLEQQETFRRQQDGKISSPAKKCEECLDTRNNLTLNIPKHLDCFDHEGMPRQYQILQETRQQELHQEDQILQQIPSPTSPPFDINSSLQDRLHDELDYGSYVVPGFSPTDLLPRCGSGKSDKPPTYSQSGSQSVKGKDPTHTSSSGPQPIGTETSINHVSISAPSPLSTSNKQALPKQKTAQKSTATSLDISHTTDSVTLSPLSCHASLSSQSVASKGDHSRLVNPKPSVKTDSNHSSDGNHIIKKSSVASSHKPSDMLVVGEKMKTCVKISPVHRPHHAGAATDADDEEVKGDDVKELVEGDEKEEEEELSFTGSDVFRPDDQGETILHCLCDIPSDHFEDLALAPGFEEAVNSSNKAQETPLFVGVHNQRTDIAKFLMKKGADVSIPCISPANAFRNEPLLQSAIHEAAELGDVRTLNALLQSEDFVIDLPRPGSGQTPLMVALHVHSFAHRNSAADRTRVVKLLLTQGASMTIQDAVEGKTPFMYAIQSRDVEIVHNFFRRMDADEARDAVTMKTSRNTTCLHFAAGLSNFDRSQKMKLIRILILKGADASSKNAEGESPRDWARDEVNEVLKSLVPGR